MDFFVLQQTTMLTINCLKMSKEWHKIVVTKQIVAWSCKMQTCILSKKTKNNVNKTDQEFPLSNSKLGDTVCHMKHAAKFFWF